MHFGRGKEAQGTKRIILITRSLCLVLSTFLLVVCLFVCFNPHIAHITVFIWIFTFHTQPNKLFITTYKQMLFTLFSNVAWDDCQTVAVISNIWNSQRLKNIYKFLEGMFFDKFAIGSYIASAHLSNNQFTTLTRKLDSRRIPAVLFRTLT